LPEVAFSMVIVHSAMPLTGTTSAGGTTTRPW
jgi:hypothetical protein